MATTEFRELRSRNPRIDWILAMGLEALRERRLQERAQARTLVRAGPRVGGSFRPSTWGVFWPDDTPERARQRGMKLPWVETFLHAPDVDPSVFAELGGRVIVSRGGVHFVALPYDRLRAVVINRAVVAAELVSVMHSAGAELANSDAGIDLLHTAGHSGKGVIVGVADWKLDFHLAELQNAGSSPTTRLLELVQQDPPDSWSTGKINDQLKATANDPNDLYTLVDHKPAHGGQAVWHGSAVTCIAAGSSASFSGAAPQADVIFVDLRTVMSLPETTDMGSVIEAVATIIAKADALNQPCVVNISAEGLSGPRDGTTLSLKLLGSLVDSPGRALVVAAGNEGNVDSNVSGASRHKRRALAYNVGLSSWLDTLELGVRDGLNQDDGFEVWVDGGEAFELSLVTPTINGVSTVYGPVAIGGSQSYDLAGNSVPHGDSSTAVVITSVAVDPRNGDGCFEVSLYFGKHRAALTPGTGEFPAGYWSVGLTAGTLLNPVYDAWVYGARPDDFFFHGSSAGLTDPDEGTLSDLSAERLAVVVGMHKQEVSGAVVTRTVLKGSSRGPTRDGRLAPDVTALGDEVRFPVGWARDSSVPRPFGGLDHTTATGTSFAAPIVAGLYALVAECRGGSVTIASPSSGEFRELLAQSAGTSDLGVELGTYTPPPSVDCGAGWVAASGLCTAATPDIDVWIRDSANEDPLDPNAGTEPFTGTVFWESPDIQLLEKDGVTPATEATHDPSEEWSNVVRVTVRNRGSHASGEVEVALFWADPGTALTFDAAAWATDDWHEDGIRVALATTFGAQPSGTGAFPWNANRVLVEDIPAGGSVDVEFGWAPPLPSSASGGAGHFCLLATADALIDQAPVASVGFDVVKQRNNVAQRNVHVVDAVPNSSSALPFTFTARPGKNGLLVWADGKVALSLELPAAVLPQRAAASLADRGSPAPLFNGGPHLNDRIRVSLKGKAALERLSVIGVDRAELAKGRAVLATVDGGKLLRVPEARMVTGLAAVGTLGVRSNAGETVRVRVAQTVDGRIVGGCTFVVRAAPETVPDQGGKDPRQQKG